MGYGVRCLGRVNRTNASNKRVKRFGIRIRVVDEAAPRTRVAACRYAERLRHS